MRATHLTTGLAMCCLLIGCNEEDTDAVEESGLEVVSVPTAVGEVAAVEKPTGSQPELGPGLQRLADIATEHLAGYLDVDKDEIRVLEAEYVTWPDSSIGCPEPDFQYMQVLTNGSRIMLTAGQRVYWYHSGGSRPPFLCENPSATAPLPYKHGET